MPELPEVETTVRDLNKTILGRKIEDIWSDFKKMIKKPKDFGEFKKETKNKKIEKVRRRGKNILIDLSGNKTLLIHQKLTGHFLVGSWKLEVGSWIPLIKGSLEEPVNRFIHLMFWLDDELMLALSDLRKFAKVELWDKEELERSKEFRSLGPEPLEKDFSFEKFKEALSQKKKGKIKQVLMDQTIIAGIGNIYSDEILWTAKVHPLKKTSRLNNEEIKRIFQAMKKVLKQALGLRGTSISDYRRPSGEKGYYTEKRKVYRREGDKCPRCGTIIKRIKLTGRSAHFCPNCQQN